MAVLAPDQLLAIAPPCLFTHFLEFGECWGCGITHAVLACLRGDFVAAWEFNPRVFIVLPIIIGEVLRLVWKVLPPHLKQLRLQEA